MTKLNFMPRRNDSGHADRLQNYLPRKTAYYCLLTICLAFGFVQPAAGQQSPTLIIETKLSGSLVDPGKVSISVKPEIESDLNTRLKTVLEDRLRQRGFKISDQADAILEFESKFEDSKLRNSNLRLRGSAGSAGGREGSIQYTLPLGKSKQPQRKVRYRVTARLADLKDRAIWQGSAEATFPTSRDRFSVLSMLTHQLAELVGTGDVSRTTKLSEGDSQ